MRTLQAVQQPWSPTVEHKMKISPTAVRRLRTERGWSQDQLAIVSGLSLRTIQRVEAEGIASLGTATSLAATYQVKLIELQDDRLLLAAQNPTTNPSAPFFGLAIITLASISESGRLPAIPLSEAFAAVNISVAMVGAALLVPSFVRLLRERQFVAIGLAVLSTPLVILLVTGVLYALVSGHSPMWQLFALGAGGFSLAFMALRAFRQST